MPITASQLIAAGALTSDHASNASDSAVVANQVALLPLEHVVALDVLKHNVAMVALNAFKGIDLEAVLAVSALAEKRAFETESALKRLVVPSALESLRKVQEILGSAQFAAQLSALNSVKLLLAQDLARLADVSHQVTSQFAMLGDSIASAALRRAALSGMRGWENAVIAFVERPDAGRFFPLGALGRGTVGVGSAVATLLPERDDIARDADDDSGLLQPESFALALREKLRSLSPRLPQRLDGAWERVSRRGPDAASQAAHSLMEAIDWTLRLAAPAPAVLAWHAAEGRPTKELNEGEPTRPLRIAWLLRERPREAKAARLHLRAIDDLVGVIQSYKHSDNEADVEAVARLIPTVEGLLIFVLGVSPEDGMT